MLPQTDALLERSISIGIGVRDANLAPFGLRMRDGADEARTCALTFRRRRPKAPGSDLRPPAGDRRVRRRPDRRRPDAGRAPELAGGRPPGSSARSVASPGTSASALPGWASRPRSISSVGDDGHGDYVRRRLARRGIDVAALADADRRADPGGLLRGLAAGALSGDVLPPGPAARYAAGDGRRPARCTRRGPPRDLLGNARLPPSPPARPPSSCSRPDATARGRRGTSLDDPRPRLAADPVG